MIKTSSITEGIKDKKDKDSLSSGDFISNTHIENELPLKTMPEKTKSEEARKDFISVQVFNQGGYAQFNFQSNFY